MALTTFNDNVQLNANKALDNRLGKYSGSKWVPYDSVAEANSYISASYRYAGLSVPVGTTSSFAYYNYVGNLADSDLIPVTSSYALTASYVANATIFPYTGSALISGSLAVTGSFLKYSYSQSTLPSNISNAGLQVGSVGSTGVMSMAGYSNNGAEIQSAQNGGVTVGGTLVLQRQAGNVTIGTGTDTGLYKVDINGASRVAFNGGSRYIVFEQRGGYSDYGRIRFDNVTGADIYSSGSLFLYSNDAYKTITLNQVTVQLIPGGYGRYGSYDITGSGIVGYSNQALVFKSSNNDTSTDSFIFDMSGSYGARYYMRMLHHTASFFTVNRSGNISVYDSSSVTPPDIYRFDVNGTGRFRDNLTVTGSIFTTGSLSLTNATSSFVATITNTRDFGTTEHGLQIALNNGGSNAYFLQGWNIPTSAERFRIDATGTITTSGSLTFISGSTGLITNTNKIYWSNDSDGYIWSPADGTFAVITNNTERYRVSSNGNILLGTSAEVSNMRMNIAGGGVQITSTGTTTSTRALDVYNSTSPSASFTVYDDQSVYIRGPIRYGAQGYEPLVYPLIIQQSWSPTTTTGINIGSFNGYQSSGANTGSYVVIGGQNTISTGSNITIGLQNSTGTPAGSGVVNGIIAIGVANQVTGSQNVQTGYAGAQQIMIGAYNVTNQYTNSQNTGIFIGYGNFNNGYWGSGLIGNGLKYYANGQLAFGGNNNSVNFATTEVYFGNGVRNENTSVNANFGNGPNVSINVSQAATASVTSKNGGTLTLRGGQGTGTGSAGDVIIATPVSRSTDDATYHAYTNRVWVKGHTGYVGINAQPTYSLDVSGSIRTTGGINITGSIIAGLTTQTNVNIVSYDTASNTFYYQPTSSIAGGSSTTTFPYTGSAIISGSLTITGSVNVSSSIVARSFTGSLFGTSSWTSNAITASYVLNGNLSGTATASAGTTTTILTVVTGSTTAIFFDYTVASGSNARAGTITGVWNGANVQYSDRSTLDIGNTSEVTMSVSLSGANALLAATTVAYPWIVKAIYRVI